MANKGFFSPITTPGIHFLTQEQVSEIISYQFPISIFQTNRVEEINEIFRRINSHGKHLSSQEVRQAGVMNVFSNLVREIASEIRGDVSKEVLKLYEMPEISIGMRNSKMKYGIVAEDTFWVKHGILKSNDLRDSEDEQFIADIILSIVLDTPFAASKERLDSYYGKGEKDLSNEAIIKVNAYRPDNLKSDIIAVYSEIYRFSERRLRGAKLKNILNPNAGSNPVKGDFYAVFMAFYTLMMKKGKSPSDYPGIAKSLKNIHKSFVTGSTTDNRVQNINICIGLIEPHFKKNDKVFRSPGSYMIDFKNWVYRSKVESSEYDFKQGLFSLDPKNRIYSEKIFENNILPNIAALANLGLNSRGFLFIGVTDKEEDTKKI
jgi:hypothetical protein